ncbi:putative phosphatase [Thiorhodovibrio winogradskyi]|uniref:Phosphatase n=1 Tax=Thiorhodovibrio winogradskyi TaxID=77007 RepID=A0ABZ0S4F1_9GAMM|nr:alkaline phosphatase PhoX [Thiorhodovibrio winogradskyi]
MPTKPIHLTITATLGLGAASLTLAGSIDFSPAPFAQTDADKRQILTSPSAMVDGRQAPLEYRAILRSGDRVGSGTFGLLHDIQGNPLLAADGSPVISNSNDFSSILTGKDGKLYMVSHFESRPGAIYLTELAQDRQTGALSAIQTRALDLAAQRGGWVLCAGSVTPWGTHLGAEEYEPDARQWRDQSISPYNAAMATYFGAAPAQAGDLMNPYDYGYPIEIDVSDFDHARVQKHYAMGRIALELGYVLPDRKTLYLSDDGTNVGLFRFVAQTPGDLSAGSLWAARWSQRSAAGAGTALLDWVYLGYASNDQVSQWKDSYRFADIFDEADPVKEKGKNTGRCPEGFSSINVGHQDGQHQCLKLRDIDGDGAVWQSDWNIASRLETRRWAAMRGATTEFRKMEGISYNPDANLLYLAMSEIDRGMLDFARVGKGREGEKRPYDQYDIGGPNHMTIARGNLCGAVYALSLDGNYTATHIFPLISGTPMTTNHGAEADSPDFDGLNHCDIDGIANPDNISYLPGYHRLIIGEDSVSGHQNDMVWAYNTQSGALTRIQTTPYGAEATSAYWYPNIKGFAYLMSVVQHPYGEPDASGIHPAQRLKNPAQAAGYTGYLVFPALDH